MLPTNGNSQLPVRSMILPASTGEMIAASADPVFIKPLANPENRGAISMGIAHIGPTVNSAKKNARLRKIAAEVKLWTKHDRQHHHQRAKKSEHDQVAAGFLAIARPLEDPVADDAAREVAQHARQKNTAGEKAPSCSGSSGSCAGKTAVSTPEKTTASSHSKNRRPSPEACAGPAAEKGPRSRLPGPARERCRRKLSQLRWAVIRG